MQEHNFDNILDFLCSGIMSKKERQNVRDELLDHLMCKYETNLAIGMDEEKAVESAINDLGDKNTLKFKLSQVHSYYPNLSMKKAMDLLIAGFCLIGFQINIIINTGEITKFIGQIVMLVAMFCLSKSNDKLKKAFISASAEYILSDIAAAIAPSLPSVVFWIPHILYIASCISNITKWFYLLYGLRDLTAPFKEEYKKTIPYGFAAFSNMIPTAYLIWLYSAMIVSEETDFGAVDEAAVIVVPLALLSIIMNLVSFVMTSKCLWQNDHEYQIETSSKKKIAVAVIAVLISVLSVVAVDLGVSFEKADTEVYSIDDSDISEAEYDRICNVLLSYGIPERLVYSLPESEIERFENAVPSSEIYIPEGYAPKYVDSQTDFGRYDFTFETHTCAVGIVQDNGYTMFRYMTWLEYGEDIKGHFSDYIQFDTPERNFFPCIDNDKNAETVLILTEENGKMIKNEPLDVYYSNVFGKVITGVKVQAKDGMLMYVGKNYSGGDMDLTSYRSMNVYHKISPITSMRNVPDVNSYENDAIGIVSFRPYSKNWIQLKKDMVELEEVITEETE